jgi:hypothetical protein
MADLQRLFDLYDPRIKKLWDEKDTQLSKRLEYSEIGLTDFTPDIPNPTFENFTGLGIAALTGEGEAYHREDILPAYKVTITVQKFTNSIPITEEMLRFNNWPKINNLVGALANSVNQSINVAAAKVLYLGFGTTFLTGGDGSALFASHTMGDGSSQSNTLGAIPLNYDNLKTACQTMDRFTDDKGVQMLPCQKLRLVVARENKEKAEEVLRSIGNPDNANRVNNVFSNGQGYIDYKVANWIPSGYSKYWFVIDMERAAMMAWMVWGWRPKFDDDKIVNNGTKVYTASTMFAPGFSSFQWVCGANSTT